MPVAVLQVRRRDHHVVRVLDGVALHNARFLLDERALPSCEVVVVPHSFD